MILRAPLFLDQILEQQLPDAEVVGVGVNAAEKRGEGEGVMPVLPGVLLQLIARERAGRPALIKRVIQKVLRCDPGRRVFPLIPP